MSYYSKDNFRELDRPIISIIVPCFNCESRVEKCLDSLLGQSIKDLEIICINDGSTDNTFLLLKKYSKLDSRISVINNEKNLGVSASRNRGISAAKAEFIMFCDADDFFDKKMCQKMLDSITRSDTDLSICEIKISYEILKENEYNDKKYYSLKYSGKHNISVNIIKNTDLSPTNKIFRKNIIVKNEIYFPEGMSYEDAFFCVAYMCCSKTISYVNEQLYTYVRHGNSIMSNTWSKHLDKDTAIDHLFIATKLYAFLVSHGLLKKYNDLFWSLFYDFEMFALNNSKTKKQKKLVKAEAIRFIKNSLGSFRKIEYRKKIKILRINYFGGTGIKSSIKRTMIRIYSKLKRP